MQRDLKALLDGALGGCAGTAAMSVVTLAAQITGYLPRHPPKDLTEAALDTVGVSEQTAATKNSLATLAHFGFGTATGALFGVLHRRLRLPIPPVLHGVIFGTLVWAVSYQGWIPALGVLPPSSRDHRGRVIAMLLAHWVYGALLGLQVARSEPPQGED